jgi:hypothetical protein
MKGKKKNYGAIYGVIFVLIMFFITPPFTPPISYILNSLVYLSALTGVVIAGAIGGHLFWPVLTKDFF